ncbi:MAG TPA: energy-coupled thiamine transporter ThiT [Candidatus Bathyarchaeia archaeon]|nr:energy-coupled thiamine transporter ThiT [Candidatus Bathyarchaeia archaeon]
MNQSKSDNINIKSNTIFQTKILAEIAVFSALSAVLYALRPFSLPYGGAVTLGSMVPTMWLSIRRGIRVGVITGAIFGAIALFVDVLSLGASSVVATPIQAVFEYPVAFGLIGLTGFLTGVFHKKTVGLALAGAGIAVFLRFLVHYFAGVFVWYYVYAFPAYGRWVFPAVYNGSFLIVEYIISAIVLTILIKRGTLDYRL